MTGFLALAQWKKKEVNTELEGKQEQRFFSSFIKATVLLSELVNVILLSHRGIVSINSLSYCTGKPLFCSYRLWVGQRPEPVVVLLPCCIPQAQVHWLPINHHIGRVIVKAGKGEVEIRLQSTLIMMNANGNDKDRRSLIKQLAQLCKNTPLHPPHPQKTKQDDNKDLMQRIHAKSDIFESGELRAFYNQKTHPLFVVHITVTQ